MRDHAAHLNGLLTCSEYAKQAIDKYGIIKGNILAIYRIIRCNPFSHGGVDKLK